MRVAILWIILAGQSSLASADVATLRWGPPDRRPDERRAIEIGDAAEGKIIRVDLSDLPDGARILRAELVLARPRPLVGTDDDARLDFDVRPLADATGGTSDRAERPLLLRAPWYDRLDATEAVCAWARGTRRGSFLVRAGPRWSPEKTYLDVTYEGRGEDLPPAATGLRVLHRSGLTSITWKEIEDPFEGKIPSLGELRATLARMEAARSVRYRIYRHTLPIDRGSIAGADLLAEVAPLSAWNPGGVSPDHAIHRRQLRAIEDGMYARGFADEPFDVSPSSPELDEVPVRRLAIEDGVPLPSGMGLYVHRPDSAGKRYYAVATCIDGVANLVDLGPGSSLSGPIAEEKGAGEPVLQGEEDLKVFYDYPGRRLHYVQWCAPGGAGGPSLANLPNRTHDWSVYVPPAAERPEGLALGIYFHDWRGLYLRPRWQHGADEILIATADAPWPTFGYGYHESIGTLRSFAGGIVGEFTAARIDVFVEWIRRKYRVDAARIRTHGSGTLGGTAAVQYGLRHQGQMSWIVAGYFDPDPGSCPPAVEVDGRSRETHLARMEAVWGRRTWDLRTAAGKSVWEDRDLTSMVKADPAPALPFFSIGAGTLSPVWRQQVPFMKALLETRQPMIAEFDWGGSPPPYAPEYVRRDGLLPAVFPERMEFAERDYWKDAAVHYSSGGSINAGLRWDPRTAVDAPDRLEVQGRFGGAVTIRGARRFRPRPGEEIAWTLEIGPHGEKRQGRAKADANGLVTIPGVGEGRIILTRAVGEGR